MLLLIPGSPTCLSVRTEPRNTTCSNLLTVSQPLPPFPWLPPILPQSQQHSHQLFPRDSPVPLWLGFRLASQPVNCLAVTGTATASHKELWSFENRSRSLLSTFHVGLVPYRMFRALGSCKVFRNPWLHPESSCATLINCTPFQMQAIRHLDSEPDDGRRPLSISVQAGEPTSESHSRRNGREIRATDQTTIMS